jgi:glycosyltransferase involved in cell wall biosynthesis/GT2 family glycosyltransferase
VDVTDVASPSISVVVPTRDRAELLDGCLAALSKAVRQGDELIVVDSASRTQAVRDVASSYDVRYVRAELPGASRARNLGWLSASNDIVAFVDDDVRVADDWVDAMRSAFASNPDATFVTGRILIPEGQDSPRPVATLERTEPKTFDPDERDLPGHSASLGVRRDALELVGGFDERMGPGADFKAAEDWDLYDRLYALGRRGRYEPAILAWHDQWRSRRELIDLDYTYGHGMGARVAKLLRTNRVHGIKSAVAVYVGWGIRDAVSNARQRRWFLAFAALVRFCGAVLGFARAIPAPLGDGHFTPPSADRHAVETTHRTMRRARPVRPLLRVGLDLTPGNVAITGVARYSRMLWEQLSSRTDVAPRAFMAGRVDRMASASILRLHVPVRALHASWRFGVPTAEALLGDVDVVHCVDMLPPPTRLPLVVMWHDTFRLPGEEYHDPRNLELREQRLEALNQASVVLTYCEATAQELVEATGYPRDRIVLSPPGYDIEDTVTAPPPVDGPFVLAAGALTPRKGFDVLAQAMGKLGEDGPVLVIAGPDGYLADQVKRQIADALPAHRYRLIGEQYGAMRSLYEHATLVCHPSLAEGFGYVCLEAMGAGAAVVAADIPSIREMGEGCVRLVQAADVDETAEAIRSLLDDPEERARLGDVGRARARTYTWKNFADQTVHAYRLAAER